MYVSSHVFLTCTLMSWVIHNYFTSIAQSEETQCTLGWLSLSSKLT